METTVFRTVRIKVKNPDMQQACRAQCLASKNLKNLGLFVVRNVLSSFDGESKLLKAELNDHQTEVLAYVNASIEIVNARRGIKNAAKAEYLLDLTHALERGDLSAEDFKAQAKACKAGKLFTALTPTSEAKLAWQILDDSLLDQVLRNRVDHQHQTPFQALPAKASEQVRKQISAEFNAWTASLGSFKSGGTAHSGRPRMPGYMGRHDLNVVKYFAGVLGAKSLPTLQDRALFLDFDKQLALSGEALQAYKNFDLDQAKRRLRGQLPADKQAQASLVELRILAQGPSRDACFYLEGVFECVLNLQPHTALARCMQKARTENIKDNQLPAFYSAQLAQIEAHVPVAGADPGLNNLLSLAFNQGDKGVIISNARLERKINLFDAKIDQLKASLATPRLRELQALQDDLKAQASEKAPTDSSPAGLTGEKPARAQLSKADFIELRTLQRAVFSHPKMRAWTQERQPWLKNALHTASRGIVDILVKKDIQVFIVGKNKDWKTESEMGRRGNRRLHATAHTELINLLRYKCEDAGILLVETEESYTSKTSFAANEELLKFRDKPNQENAKAKKDHKPAPAASAPALTDTASALHTSEPRVSDNAIDPPQRLVRCGTRRAAKGSHNSARHEFISRPLSGRPLGRWTSIHADSNGAYNIIRKLIPAFGVHEGLSSQFELMWLSPSGLRPFISLNREWASGGVQKRQVAASVLDNRACASHWPNVQVIY